MQVRQNGFERSDELKAANQGVGMQRPKEVGDARKNLYSIIKKKRVQEKIQHS